MFYDESIKRAEQMIAQLESAEAISMEEYKRIASEVTAILKQCQSEITSLAKELNV